ncbi:hypothetical protein FIBSPDRAFT_909075 [Athelia psychrophila]|uniref:DUF6589 domain-containing protein n=1 Tax=Athelia psychrophila TaxID=1759441 RepID=A0A166Q3P7_9AGAM|nr:hypothetical protein FIBSPDRAFT_909075 [Fibularhizoctonia sp. CBS 109695]
MKLFDSLGEFLSVLFYCHPKKSEKADPRTARHISVVSAFLQGTSVIHMGHIIDLIYSHRQSQPKRSSRHANEVYLAFSPTLSPAGIHHARPAMSSWATKLVGDAAHRAVGRLTKNDPEDPDDITQLRATTNGRAKNVRVAAWKDYGKLSMTAIGEKYLLREHLVYYLVEAMAGPRDRDGNTIVRERRPHTNVVVGAISALVLARNRNACGYFSMPFGAFQFACHSHVDVKRSLSRLGLLVSDKTTRLSLQSMTDSSMALLRDNMASSRRMNKLAAAICLDNCQQYVLVHEDGLGKQNQLKVGTAATAIYLDDCAPGAFDAQDYIARVAGQERKSLTTNSLWNDIDWDRMKNVMALHWVRVLVEFIPELKPHQKEVSARFRTSPIAKHRMREGRKTAVQPLGTNAEREIETEGMKRAVLDFEGQMGTGPESAGFLSWIRGDGGSFAAANRVKKYLSATGDDYKAFRNRLTTPEIWHMRSTNLNTISDNHYGPAASQDPSSLSKSSNCVQFTRPSNTSEVNFYPTVRALTLFWEMQVIDCWRQSFGVEDILVYFENLPADSEHRKLDTLLQLAPVLVKCNASQDAYFRALSRKAFDNSPADMKVTEGSPWVAAVHNPAAGPSTTRSTEKNTSTEKKCHVEADGFDGDRVLANSTLFLEDFGWWIEAAYAVPEGDMGRVMEVLKIWIFVFAGSSNQNYKEYLLEFYCLLKYESSQDLHDAILNNMLVNLTGELGSWIEGDLLQEHYNKWLEDMVGKRGGDFDDAFYRRTISPNVDHFLRIKELMQSAFDLKPRSKTHPEAHLRAESTLLLTMYKETELRRFRSTRSMGHAPRNYLDRGFTGLDRGKMDGFLSRSTDYSDIVAMVQALKTQDPAETNQSPTDENTNAAHVRTATVSSTATDSSTYSAATDNSDAPDAAGPDDHGLDNSEKKLSSGSYGSMYIESDTGLLVGDWTEEQEVEAEYDNNGDEVEDDDGEDIEDYAEQNEYDSD